MLKIICDGCNTTLPSNLFNKNSFNENGYSSFCIDCSAKNYHDRPRKEKNRAWGDFNRFGVKEVQPIRNVWREPAGGPITHIPVEQHLREMTTRHIRKLLEDDFALQKYIATSSTSESTACSSSKDVDESIQ